MTLIKASNQSVICRYTSSLNKIVSEFLAFLALMHFLKCQINQVSAHSLFLIFPFPHFYFTKVSVCSIIYPCALIWHWHLNDTLLCILLFSKFLTSVHSLGCHICHLHVRFFLTLAPRWHPAPCENVFQIFPLPLTNTLIKLSNLLDICPCASHWQWHLNVIFILYFIFIQFFLYTYYVFTSICLPHIYSFKFHFNCIF